jgi:anti-sigma-K factor RskA
MNIHNNEALIERLAAEYALGTLRGGARRRFEAAMQNHAVVRRSVAEWQDRLLPMAEFSSSISPSPQVWDAIQQRLDLSPGSNMGRQSFWQGLRENLTFWRGLGMASTALATILVAVLVTKQLEPAAPAASYVAMLADDKAQPVAIVTGNAGDRRLTVKLIAPQNIAADRSLELWAVPKEGNPRSLGLLAADGSISLPLPENATPQSIPLLAVTLEPKGGSPNPNGPTGPIVFKGAWVQI